ncbi:hypothetical protein FB45DRAFT_935917 [Roridomyces roridus]|uniref:C3H1-type domain-containing protein n=1 Tax=Roridomyces roridus TaxID=1738132 RepID=A0AAD7BAV8_9AGAR|nr:hypothetical protein FB45DRAFT_935917 [Roridomyces roridus]
MSSSNTPAADVDESEAVDSADPVIVVLTPDTASASERRERALAERAEKRQTILSRKRQLAKNRQAFGVTLMKIKNYQGAVLCFADACTLWKANPVCHCDLATAYLHLGRFPEAEVAASAALALDPKLVEARYTRAIARRGQGLLRAAIVDLETVLELDPANEAAKTALHDLNAALAVPESAAPESTLADYTAPVPTAPPLEMDDEGSDTSDANHTGSGVPCLFYNHGGCARSKDCKFSHATDEKSVRDDIGKNVCLYLLLDACKFGDKCIYSHDRSYLPTNTKAAWWEDEARVAEMRERIDKVKEEAKEKREEREKSRAAAKEKKGKRAEGGDVEGESSKDKKRKNKNKNRRGPGHVRGGSMGSFGGGGEFGGAPQFSPQHMVFPMGLGLGLPWNGGFVSPAPFAGGGGGFAALSQYDVGELAAQGVKPWDEDAQDVLAALR